MVRKQSAQSDRLSETQASGFVDQAGVLTPKAGILFVARYEETSTMMQAIAAGEIQIAAICNKEGSRLVGQIVENVDVVNVTGGQKLPCWEVAATGQQGVEFDGSFSPS